MSPRSSQRVDRRRRVLADESRHEETLSRPRIFRGDDEGPLSRYDERALFAINAPIVRYLPFRLYALLLWFLAGLLPVLGLMLLDQRKQRLADWLGADALRIFRLDGVGNLASWISSLVFVAAAVIILGIYSVRRNRRDDYRARFTVWQWALGAALIACFDVAVDAHSAFQTACERFVGEATWGAGSAWWVTGWATVGLLTVVRLGREIATSRYAIVSGCAAVACYFWCGLVQLDVGGAGGNEWTRGSQMPLVLLGHHFILFTLVCHARDVIREAMGLDQTQETDAPCEPQVAETAAPVEQPTASTRRQDSHQSADSLQMRISSATVEPCDEESADVASASQDDQPQMKVVSDGGEESVDMSKLSKAEKRKLRKLQKQQRRKAA